MTEEFEELGIKQGRGFLEGVCDYRKPDTGEEGYLFRLNGISYAMWENESDGYRSYCEMEKTDSPCDNTFPPQEVFVKLFDDKSNKGIEIFNIDDASLILKIATDYYDDYYPCAVMEWHPENMPINKQ
jgi:hypothetical protein